MFRVTDKIVVFSTCETAEEARNLARALVETGLAACVNIVPQLTSVYRWKGAVEEASEFLLIVKTRQTLLDEVRNTIERLHSYELPEVIAFEVAGGSTRYLEWLSAGLKPEDSGSR
jgi:periplasmic divalent cation tolerance protein